MTAPKNPAGAQPEVRNANELADADKTSEASSSDTRYVVKTPWSTSVFRGEGFPDITPDGTEMSSDEREAARDAARILGLKLSSNKVNGGEN